MEKNETPTRNIRTKVVTIGDGAVGKTSIVRRFLGWGFKQKYLPTVGADFYSQEDNYELDTTNLEVEWTVWDISGQPEFEEIRSKYYLGAGGAIIVFDITREKTAEHTRQWVQEFYDKVGEERPFVLLGNKVDLRGTKHERVPPEVGKKLAAEFSKQYGITVPYLESSAKTKKNLDEAFKILAKKIGGRVGEL